MNIYQKLMKTRVEFHKLKLEKSGHNKFAGFKYFELSDFLIPATEILEKNGLCPIIRFDEEMARMTVFNTEKTDETIEFTSPMRSLELKGANAIQSLGGVQTYLTRYLYIQLLNIVENDTFDATSGQTQTIKSKQQATTKVLSEAQLKRLYAIGYGAGMDKNTLDENIKKKYGKLAKELTKEEYDYICSSLEGKK